MRLLLLPGGVGIWLAAAALGGTIVVTALFTALALALAVWALAVLGEE